MRIGHAMRRPVPGFLSDMDVQPKKGPLIYGNSDLSGFSIFEEAQYRGVTAVERALREIGRG
jgi:hypothetical protein